MRRKERTIEDSRLFGDERTGTVSEWVKDLVAPVLTALLLGLAIGWWAGGEFYAERFAVMRELVNLADLRTDIAKRKCP